MPRRLECGREAPCSSRQLCIGPGRSRTAQNVPARRRGCRRAAATPVGLPPPGRERQRFRHGMSFGSSSSSSSGARVAFSAEPPRQQQCSLGQNLAGRFAAALAACACRRPDALALFAAAGTLQRDFKHLAVDMFLTEEEGQKVLKVDCHFGRRKALASIRTCTSHVMVSAASG